MFDNTGIKEINDAVLDYATTATKKTYELQTALLKDFVALNKKLYEISPAKNFSDLFVSTFSNK
jgi:hypothetical protein